MKIAEKILYPMLALMLLTGACSNTVKSNEGASGAAGDSLSLDENGEIIGQHKTLVREVGPVSIKGSIKGGAGQPVYLQIVESKDVKPLDTIVANDKGEYAFTYSTDRPEFYRVGVNEQNSFYLVLSPGESVVTKAEIGNMFKSFEVVEGPEECHRMKEMNGLTGMKDSINMIMQAAQMNNDKRMMESAVAAYENINIKMEREIKAFINRKPAGLSSMAALQNLNFDIDFAYYDKVVRALDGVANGNDIYDNMKAQIEGMRNVAIGAVAPEITLAQPNGEVLSLSDLRGQYVLIDFWASWCGPCRRENPNVKKVYDKYHEKGFEIYGVSLDKTQQAWLNAIGQDGLEWKHVSDLKYWQSEVVAEYQITGIPLTILLDKEGVIIGKNLRGVALEEKLAQIFGE